jgi:hypothetical protein
VQPRSNKRGILGLTSCVVCALMAAGCELDNTGTPRIIPGPFVPSPTPLHAPYVWDTREELVVWTENAVSRGSLSIDDADSNGAIVIQFMGASGQSGGSLVLRGPDLVPPASSIRAVRIRYQWLQDPPSDFGLPLSMTIDAANAPSAASQSSDSQRLKAGPGWKEMEFRHHQSTPLDVRYVYFTAYSNAGVLKIDTITLVG